jgi:low temperature requirement protein LtrA
LLFLRPLRRPDTAVPVAAALISVGMVVAALASTPWVAIVGAVLAGACDGVMITAMFIVRNREAPEHARGQVFTIAASLRTAAFAAAGAAMAPLADRPAVWALGIGAAIQLSAVVLGRLSVLRRPDAGRPDAGRLDASGRAPG